MPVFASWLETHGAELVEQDELLGYHLERAGIYHIELGTSDEGPPAAAARQHLIAEGRRAARQDYGAAVSLFVRAAALAPAGERDLLLETELGDALEWTGRLDESLRRADALAERATTNGDRIGALCGRIRAAMVRTDIESGGSIELLEAVIGEALPVFQAAHHDIALYVAYSALGNMLCWREQRDAALEAFERGFAHAGREGHLPTWAPMMRAGLRCLGTTPVTELLAWLDEQEPQLERDQFFRAFRSWSLAMVGRFDEARAILSVARAEQAERGGGTLLANLTVFESACVELLAGDLIAAAAFAAEGFRRHEELGDEDAMSGAAAIQARLHYALDRFDEAELWADRAAALGSGDHIGWELEWRPVKAQVLARRGEPEAAERLIRETVAMCDRTELLDLQGTMYAALGEVLFMVGRAAEVSEAFEEAVARYERKGNTVMAGRTRARLGAVKR